MAPEQTPSAEQIRRARVFWKQSGQDLKSARARLKKQDYLQSSLLSLQATVNGLSAVCHLHGHFQLPVGSASELLALCAEEAEELRPLLGACAALDEAMEQDPFAAQREADREAELSRRCLEEGRAVLDTVKRYLKRNRRRFFSP